MYVTFIIKKNAVKMMEVSMKKLDRKSITMSMLGLVAIVGVGQQVLADNHREDHGVHVGSGEA